MLRLCFLFEPIFYLKPSGIILRAAVDAKITKDLIHNIRDQLMHSEACKKALRDKIRQEVEPFLWIYSLWRAVDVYPKEVCHLRVANSKAEHLLVVEEQRTETLFPVKDPERLFLFHEVISDKEGKICFP